MFRFIHLCERGIAQKYLHSNCIFPNKLRYLPSDSEKLSMSFRISLNQNKQANLYIMSRVCQVTGKKTISGNNVSKANNKVRRKFYPNLQTKRFFVPEEDRWVTLKVSAKGIKVINKRGITSVLKDMRARGEKV